MRDDLAEAIVAANVTKVRVQFEIPDDATVKPRRAVSEEELAVELCRAYGFDGRVVSARAFRPFGGGRTVVDAVIEPDREAGGG